MRIQYQKITEPLDLGDYSEKYRGTIMHVWVNPPRAKLQERQALGRDMRRWTNEQLRGAKPEPDQKKGLAAILAFFRKPVESQAATEMQRLNAAMDAWLADLWSQGEDPELHWTVDEIRMMYDTDPRLLRWLTQKSLALIEDFRSDQKKA